MISTEGRVFLHYSSSKNRNSFMLIKYHLQLFLLLVFSFSIFSNPALGQSNEGKEFWFGFMEHRDVGSNTKVAMITSKFNTTGTISIPSENWSQTFSVNANQVTIITLPAAAENIGSESVDDLGIHLLSNQPVSVYIHQYHNFRSEATVVLPVSSLSNEYYVMTYRGVLEQGNIYPSEFLIVATEDETTIDILLSDETIGGQPAGSTISIFLQKGDTYQVQGAKADDDLSGTRIVGDKNFTVFAGNTWTEVTTGCFARDNLMEQMYPVSTWGRKVATVPIANMNYDVFRIMAAEDNTFVQVIGSTTQNYTLHAGEFVEYLKSEATLIQADKPIQVAQFLVGSGCGGYVYGDPSMVLLNSVEQTRDTVTLYNSNFQAISENFISFIAATDDIPFITFDGNAIPTNAQTGTIGLNDEFTYVRLQVGVGSHTIISDACGVIAMAYGYGNLESYAYSGGASFNSINLNPIPEGGCLNDTIFFDAQLPDTRYSFFWDLGDGNTTTESTFQHFYPDLGYYPVELIVTDECLGTVDTFNRDLLISLRQAVETLGDTLICEAESFSLGATDLAGAKYEWTGPNGYFSEEQFPTVYNATPEMSGNYDVIGIVSGCATFPTTSYVEVIPFPEPDLGPDTIFCNKNYQTTLSPGTFSEYVWQDNSTLPILNIFEDGDYSVQVTDQYGCVGFDEVTLRNICPTVIYVPNAFSPNFDGYNDYFQVYAEDYVKMRLRIFDRWGNFLFEGNSAEESWDGTFNGKDMKQGVYVWILEVDGYRADGTIYSEVLSGDVTIVK